MATPRTDWSRQNECSHAVVPGDLTRLDWRDAAEVAELLNGAWETSYGPTARPSFDPDYLRWLYGGPAAHEHLLLGRRKGGRLVAFKAMLARHVVVDGQPFRAHLSTHLTVDPGLALGDRLESLTAIVCPHSLVAEAMAGSSPVDMTIAFYEAGKRIVRDSETVLERFGLVRSQRMFPQSIVNPAALDAAAPAGAPHVRRATVADLAAIARLWDRVVKDLPFAVTMTAPQLRHHLFGLASAHVFVAEAEQSGQLSGALLCYEMETVRFGRRARVVAVDYLLVEARAAAVALVTAALAVARATGARGVVLENATALDADLQHACGIVPSARRMLLSVVARDPVPLTDRFLIDVK